MSGTETARFLFFLSCFLDKGLADYVSLDLVRAFVDLGDLGVAHHPLDGVLADVAVAAEHLDRVGGDPHRRVAGEQLGHRGFARDTRGALILGPGGAIDQQRRSVDLHRHVGDVALHHLQIAKRRAEQIAAAGALDRLVHGAASKAKRRGADDAIFLAEADVVLEGPTTNVWWRNGQTLFTPSLETGILAGITREFVLEAAPGLGYEIAEGVYTRSELAAAEEAFTSSSVRELMPLVQLDGAALGDGRPGPAAAALQQALRRAAAAG